MGGTLLNTIAVVIGSAFGLLIGNRLPQRIQQSVITAIGLVTVFIGISNAGHSGNVIIPLISLIIGVIIGELLHIDLALERLGAWLQARIGGKAPDAQADDQRGRFINGFVTASLVFCIGPLAFAGSIQDGMGLAIGFQQLAIKSVLDLFTSIAFASSLGVGVAFSSLAVLIVQGGFALAGLLLGNFMSAPMINEMTAVGGILLIGLALILLDLKKPRIANFLPALLIAPLMVALATALNLTIYPHIP
ncbi:MAG TPA: DUF554 domain-containing protein [Phototrophicaceae bacterium]|nr:DUF554 domain-containing protein [Phototrophicaceae bacterium]